MSAGGGDESLSLSVLGDISSIDRALNRLGRSLDSIENAYLSVASAAGVAEGQVDDAGDEASEAAGEYLALAGAIETAEGALADFGNRNLNTFDSSVLASGFRSLPDDIAESTAAIEQLDAVAGRAGGETRYSVAVDRSGLAEAFEELPAQRVRVNPVLQALEGELDTPISEDVEQSISESVSRERSVAVETENITAAAGALAELNRHGEDVRSTFATLEDDRVRLNVETDGADETIAALQSIGVAAEAIDGQDSAISVALDQSDYDPDALAALPSLADQQQALTTTIDADTDLSSDMDLRGSQQYFDAVENRLGNLTADAPEIANQVIDVSMSADEREVLSAIDSVRAGLESLPDDERVGVFTDADLDGIVRTAGSLDALPDEVDVDVDALTSEAQTALSAVVARAHTVDDLDPTVNVDVEPDRSAVSTLRGLGEDESFGMDFDLPEFDSRDRDRGSFLGEAAGGFGSLVAGGSRAVPGLAGAGAAASAMSAPALAGAGVGAGGLASMLVGGASALGGGALASGGALGSLALGVSLATDESEIASTKQRIQDQLGVLEQNVDFNFLSDTLRSDAVAIVGDVAQEVDSISGQLRTLTMDVREGFWREWPAILSESSNLITSLDDELSDMAIGGLEAAPGIIREIGRAGEAVLPLLSDLASPSLDILGSSSRVGTGALEFVLPLFEQGLDFLAAFAPAADLAGDALSVAGGAAGFFMDAVGDPSIEAFGGYVEWSAENVRWLAEGIDAIGSTLGVWDGLATIIRGVGDGLGFVYSMAENAYDTLASGAEWVLGKILDLHNAINDVPGAAEMSSFISEEDIAMPDLSSIGPDRADGEGPSPGPGTPPSASAAAVESSAIASLPSNTTAASQPPSRAASGTSSTASTPRPSSGTSSTASTPRPSSGTSSPSSTPPATTSSVASGGTTIHNNITVEGGMPRSDARLNRMIRKIHRQLNKRQAKMSGSSTG